MDSCWALWLHLKKKKTQSWILNIKLEMLQGRELSHSCSIIYFFFQMLLIFLQTLYWSRSWVTNGLVFQPPWKCHVGVNKTTYCMFYKELQPPLNYSDFHLGQAGWVTSCLDGCVEVLGHDSVTCPAPQFADVTGCDALSLCVSVCPALHRKWSPCNWRVLGISDHDYFPPWFFWWITLGRL